MGWGGEVLSLRRGRGRGGGKITEGIKFPVGSRGVTKFRFYSEFFIKVCAIATGFPNYGKHDIRMRIYFLGGGGRGRPQTLENICYSLR